MKPIILASIGAFIGVMAGNIYVSRQHYVAQHRLLNPALSPGAICDAVATETEHKPTVAWYQACISYAAEVQAKCDGASRQSPNLQPPCISRGGGE